MAKLNPSIIFLMTRDLSDLQEIGKEMIDQIGKCDIPSWRYPDRRIQDVEFEKDEDAYNTEEKYVLLLELIVDRLYFVLNMALTLLNSMPEINQNQKFKQQKNISQPSAISLGTLISFFWKRLQVLTSTSSNLNKCNSINNNSTHSLITNETTSSVCTNCPTTFTILKNLIKNVEECMHNLKIFSKTSEYRDNIENQIMKLSQTTALEEWYNALFQDMKTITSQANFNANNNIKLNEELCSLKKENDFCLRKITMMQSKITQLESQNQDATKKITILNQQIAENSNKITAYTNELITSANLYKKSEEKNLILQTKIIENSEMHEIEINNLNKKYKNLFETEIKEKENLKELYEKSQEQVEEMENNVIEEREKLLELSNKMQDAIAKQKALIEDKNAKLATENKSLLKQILNLEKDEKKYITQINTLEDEKLKIKKELKQSKEREIILLRCPDLNGPINCKPETQNPLQDMKEQFDANEIRIKLLQEQNTNLRRIIEKMKHLPHNFQ